MSKIGSDVLLYSYFEGCEHDEASGKHDEVALALVRMKLTAVNMSQ